MKLELLNDDDVVISGIGFKVPEADNLSELEEQLFGEKLPASKNLENNNGGKIADKKKFDFTFFGVSNMVARSMDVMTKQILERTFEAVIDAGINPVDIKGSNSFVFSGSSFSDFDLAWLSDSKGGYGIMGRNRCMNANRVSYFLDLKGTSVSYDSNYANGIQNIVNAWESIKKGLCDTALVSTANFQSVAEVHQQLNDLKKLSPDGICKSYDDSANGWIRSDAVVVFVLQRATAAKRCYAVIEHAMSDMYGGSPDILHSPSQTCWEIMLNEFYANSSINPNDIFYVEGDGMGIKEDDAEELNALSSVFCKNRKTPLLVGSIKSNIGHTEASSASCGILKAIISLEKGIVPKNLHYKRPNSLSPGLVNGKIQIADKNVEIPSNGLIAVNARSIAGIYGHVVLRGNPKTKRTKQDGIPRLVPLSVRQDKFMDDVIDKLEAEPFDPEQIRLLHDIFSKSMDRYLSRGYTILPKIDDASVREHQVFDPLKRPVWFIFSGMGSQWSGMGKRLMDLPIFRASIEKSHEILTKKGLNLIEIITSDDPTTFDNILHSFVGIAAIQIALVDILNALGIVPDNMIGHSVGELGCSYADGCLTAEQTILCAYSRGKASLETPLTKGFMAAIGKGYNEIKNELPEGIEVACHNAADSCTISGPAESVQNYVKELQDRKVFARTVNVANIAYHSQYIKPAAPKLLQYLKDVIPNPKPRSEKWISTSILEENWNSDLAKNCSAEYHTNNLLSSVYFEEGSKKIPENAICIEIAPHGLLQAILKRSLGKDCNNIPLTNRTAKDPLIFFLQAIGKMYIAGLNPQVQELYPKIEYPASKATLSLHQFVRWQHDHVLFSMEHESEKEVIYSLKDRLSKTSEDYVGYLIDEHNYYPFSVFIVLIWEIFASFIKIKLEKCTVVFENLRVENPIPIHLTEADNVYISVGLGTGKFEILKDHQTIATGQISYEEDLIIEHCKEIVASEAVPKTEIYERFDRENFLIGKYFKSLNSLEITENVKRGKISICSDWLQTLESMIQLKILDESETFQSPLFPLSVEKLVISPKSHETYKESLKNSNVIVTELHKFQNIIKCGGIEMKGLKLQNLPKVSTKLKFKFSRFVPFVNPPLKDLSRFVDYCFGIVKNNVQGKDISILQVSNGVRIPAVASYLQDYFPQMNVKFDQTRCENTKNIHNKYDFVITSAVEEATSLINDKGFLFAICPKKRSQPVPVHLESVTKYSLNLEDFILFKKKEIPTNVDYVTVPGNESMLYDVVKGFENKSKRITYLISYSAVEEKVRERLQKEFPQLRWIFILDTKAPTFDPGNAIYADQLRKGLTTNIYLNGSWGSFYQRQFTEKNLKVDSVFTKVNGELTTAYFGTDEDEDLANIDKFQVEYSGELKDDTRVMGIASIKNRELVPDPILRWNIPSTWTLEDGATVPLSYSLMYYYLKIVADTKPDEPVLVTDGLSFNGRAAISVTLSLGLKIYVTVKEEKEISELKRLYPDINEKDILIHGDSDVNFDYRLSSISKDSYPNVIINNLEEDELLSGLNSVPTLGKVYHFGKKDLKKNTELGLYYFVFPKAFIGASSAVIDCIPQNEKEEIRDYVDKSIKNGFIKPLPRVVCNAGKFKRENNTENRIKTLYVNDKNRKLNRVSIDSEKSYVIIDDDSNFGLKIAEWLIHQNVRNIIISSQDPPFSKKYLRTTQEQLQRQLTVIVENGCAPTELLTRAKKLGPLAAVFCVKMGESSKPLASMDKLHRNAQSHLVLITKDDSLSKLCEKRTEEGYISTNFIWKSRRDLSHPDISSMVELCGEDSVIFVNDDQNVVEEAEKTKSILLSSLPDSTQKFYDLGSVMTKEINVIELPNLGLKNSEAKELSPIFIIPGLQDDPKKTAMSISKKLMYPVFLVQFPNELKDLSVEKLGSLISSKIQSTNNNRKCYNILGLSWGSYIAIEVTRLLEKSGRNVSLMLVNTPETSANMKISLETNLIDIIQRTINPIANDIPNQKSNSINIGNMMKNLNVPEEKAKLHLTDAINYIYNYLQAIFNYSYLDIKLNGPVTIINKEDMDNRSSLLKICNNITVYNLPESQTDGSTSKEMINIIHGSSITGSMSDHTVQRCTYNQLENFLKEEKMHVMNNLRLIEEAMESGSQAIFAKKAVNQKMQSVEAIPL